jgi:hypothetical protein
MLLQCHSTCLKTKCMPQPTKDPAVVQDRPAMKDCGFCAAAWPEVNFIFMHLSHTEFAHTKPTFMLIASVFISDI